MTPGDGPKPVVFDSGRLSHAYIASGSLADLIAMAAVCSGQSAKPCMSCKHCNKASRRVHPDITIVEKPADKREILVDQIRELKKDVIVVPCEASMKAYIISEADLMNRNAQNAFLQMLEEPPAHAVFVLKTENPSQLLPTVRSRCVELKSRIGQDETGQAASETAGEFFSAIEKGNSTLVAFMFRLDKLDKERYGQFIAAARGQAAVMLGEAANDETSIPRETLSRADRILARGGEMLDLNVNTGHISGFICASLLATEN